MDDSEIPPRPPRSNVTVLQFEGRTIHLIGTAHISQDSVDEVQRVIAELRPDTVCVELDQGRFDALTQEHRFEKLDIKKIVRENRALAVLASLTLTAFQKRIGKKLGVSPGAELLAAVRATDAVGAKLVLADRDVQATLKRSWASLRGSDRAQLMFVMVGSFFSSNEISAEQVEAMKDKDTIGELMQEFARAMPPLQIPLIDERDRYLMSTMQEAPGKLIVGVVGAAHVPGMVRWLGKPVDRKALSELPKPTLSSKLRPWLLPLAVVGTVALIAPKLDFIGHIDLLEAWLIPTAGFTLLGALLAGANPVTLLVAALSAPFVRLNPLRQNNSPAVAVEAWLRNPSVEQRRDVGEAILTMGGMRRNAFTRVLLVAAGVEFGGRLGALVGLILVLLRAWRG
jgi:pheromone shutdown-related protein TraB